MTYCPTWFAVERAVGSIINYSGKFEDLVLMIAERQTYRQRDRDIIQTCYSIVKILHLYLLFYFLAFEFVNEKYTSFYILVLPFHRRL